MTAERGTLEGDWLELLVTLVQAWEARNLPLDLPEPIAAVRYRSGRN